VQNFLIGIYTVETNYPLYLICDTLYLVWYSLNIYEINIISMNRYILHRRQKVCGSVVSYVWDGSRAPIEFSAFFTFKRQLF